MKKLFSLLAVCAVAVSAIAVPARPGGIVRTLEDGTQKTVFIHGDEHFHYITDAEGNWLEEETLKPLSAEVQAAREQRGIARMQARRIAERKKVGGALNLAPRGLIILVSFSDKAFSTPLETINEMINGDNYSRSYTSSSSMGKITINASGSARKYFQDQSWGQYNPTFDVVGPVTLEKQVSYYGKDMVYQGQTYEGYDEHADEMISEACKLANSQFNVDFTQYDNDNDGYVDFVYVIYAGYGQADGGNANTIWPHNSTLIYEGQGIVCKVDGKQVNNYACSNEINYSSKQYNGIGTFCHEFSHVLGLPDLYITEGSASHKTMGDWDILDSGPYNNDGNTPPAYSAYERFYCGWVTPRVLKDPEEVTLHLLNDTKEALLISKTDVHNLVGNDPDPTEFYLLENRKKEGWDQYIPGAGMLLTHIRYSAKTWENNSVNNTKSSMGVDIVEADGKTPSGSSGNSGYYGKAKDAFPAGATAWTALENHEITNIKLQNDIITFTYRSADGIEDIEADGINSVKIIRDGKVFIIRNGQIYDLNGTRL
jgi:M6 family metalloprotease-like protein